VERTLAYVALFAALIAVLGFLPRIDLIAGVPITFQSLGVMLAGAVLGARKGAMAVLLFLVLIALGLPLLSGGANLWSVLYTPRIGYVIAFPIAAFVTGWLTERLTKLPLPLAAGLAAIGGGMIVLYAIGIPVAAYMNDLTLQETAFGALAFLPGDLTKAAVTGVVTSQLARMRPGVVMSRA
jgi:biotin transport system substrate-specific component